MNNQHLNSSHKSIWESVRLKNAGKYIYLLAVAPWKWEAVLWEDWSLRRGQRNRVRTSTVCPNWANDWQLSGDGQPQATSVGWFPVQRYGGLRFEWGSHCCWGPATKGWKRWTFSPVRFWAIVHKREGSLDQPQEENIGEMLAVVQDWLRRICDMERNQSQERRWVY